ncbi:MAG: GatB/YqeY domain-containing protein [Acidobacteriota bacterium]|jgi:uncharacterized protein YqeY
MSIFDRITADMKEAMKSQDAQRLSTLRMAKAALMNEQNKRGIDYVLTDEESVKTIQSLVKQRKDSVEQYTAGGREELAAKERLEITVLEAYLPQAATPEEIIAAVDAAVGETGASTMKDMGTVMKAVMVKLQGKSVDGKLVSESVKSKLG